MSNYISKYNKEVLYINVGFGFKALVMNDGWQNI